MRLYDWAPSPFCIKTRAILDWKGFAWERIAMTPESFAELERRGGVGKVPALDIDGELIVDSTDIAERLEALRPEPPVLPSDPRELALCRALEDWADEALYFNALYMHWVDPAGRAQTEAYFAGQPGAGAMFEDMARKTEAQLAGQGTGRKGADHVRRDLVRQLETAEGLLVPGPFLLGDRPCLADFALMGQLVYLSYACRPGPEVLEKPAIAGFLAAMRGLRPI
ncbi:glutathione S-transferase [Brevundimonas alba]|uniref:Glutathione S-transferase n=1 Tax=Brevundimonas alba TaxID=74314 RepID=A0A7X5YIT5_9CAUL|nr:glutathione S-transferase family protein [Brevundimonas alba]NJC39961.1 glutathione S-transferase [Brevundimonas alba]